MLDQPEPVVLFQPIQVCHVIGLLLSFYRNSLLNQSSPNHDCVWIAVTICRNPTHWLVLSGCPFLPWVFAGSMLRLEETMNKVPWSHQMISDQIQPIQNMLG